QRDRGIALWKNRARCARTSQPRLQHARARDRRHSCASRQGRQDRHGNLLCDAIRSQPAVSNWRNESRPGSTELRKRVFPNGVSAVVANHGQLNDCFNLMQTLMAYRQDPIHWQFVKIRDKYSMLHLDVLLLIYHFAKTCSGQIVELGALVGGATIAAAWGVRDGGKPKSIIAVEPGGSVKHDRLGTKNIFRDLQRNLVRQRVADRVTLIKGRSSELATITAVTS